MQSYAAIYVLKGLFRAQLINVVVYTILIIVGDVSLKPTKFHTQSRCCRQGGATGAVCPGAPIVRGPSNSAGLNKICSSVTFQSSFFNSGWTTVAEVPYMEG